MRARLLLMPTFTRVVLASARGVNRIAIGLIGILTLVLTGVVLLEVLYRYVLELALVWSDEAARHLLVWLSFLGGGVAIAGRLHPRIELIDSLHSRNLRKAVEVIVSLLVLGFLVILFLVSADVATTYNVYRSLGLGIPQSIPRMALPVGACLMAINVLAKLLEEIANARSAEGTVAA